VSVRTPDDDLVEGAFGGDGPIDAVFHAINAATGVNARLRDFNIGAVTGGQDALGEGSIVVEVDGYTGSGQAVATDIVDACARAYLRALSNAVHRRDHEADIDRALAPTP
jgi:2-isopropylmalate synthase